MHLSRFLFYAREAMNALVIAGFSAYLINPVVTFLLERTRLSRALAVNIVYFSALILLVGLPASLTPVFFNEAQLVVQDLLDLTTEVNVALSHPVLIGPYEFHFEELGRSLTELQNTVLSPLPEELLQLLESTSIGVLWFLVIMVAVHLFLSHWPKMRDWLLGLAPVAYQDEARELYRRIRQVWMAYLRGQIVLMLIVGVVFTIAWAIIGIPGALALGVVAGFFTLVPDVGPFLAAVLAVGVALLEGSSWIPLSNVWVAGITLVYLSGFDQPEELLAASVCDGSQCAYERRCGIYCHYVSHHSGRDYGCAVGCARSGNSGGDRRVYSPACAWSACLHRR